MLAKDSIDALKAKEEELMYKQNMAPYLSDSNNINNLPKANSIFNSIFGTQSSSLINKILLKTPVLCSTGVSGTFILGLL